MPAVALGGGGQEGMFVFTLGSFAVSKCSIMNMHWLGNLKKTRFLSCLGLVLELSLPCWFQLGFYHSCQKAIKEKIFLDFI